MSAAESIARRKCVLLVEDHVDALELYASELRAAGYYVIEAPTLLDARTAVVGGTYPDVVVLDCRLPDGDGLLQLEAWRNGDTPMSKVPIIVLTASVHRQDIGAALLAGADQFVPKPCPGNELVLHVARALDQSRPSARLRRVTP